MIRRALPSALLVPALVLPGSAQTPDAATTQAMLETIGVFGGAAVYHSFLGMGRMGEAFAAKGLSSARVFEAASISGALGEAMEKAVDRLLAKPLPAPEKRSLQEIRQVCVLLQTEARALAAWAKSGSADDKRSFDQAHAAVEAPLNKLLGL